LSRKIAIRTPTYDRKIGNKFFIYFFCFNFIIFLLSLTLITDSSFGIESYEFENKWNTSCEAIPDEWACNPSYIMQDGVFRYPTGIAVDNNGNVYVADSWNDRIQKFTSDGDFITKIESIELDDGKKTLEEMFDLKVTGMKILVSDSRTDALEIFSILS